MDILVDELARGLPDLAATVRIVLRALTAALLGGVIGYERGRTGKDAGLRTHMLMSLGTAHSVRKVSTGSTAAARRAGT